MSYQVIFNFYDQATGAGTGDLCDWGPDHENLVQKDSVKITDQAWGPGFKPALNTVSMSLTWDSVLVSRIMATIENPDLVTGPHLQVFLPGQTDPAFTGYIRPSGNLAYSEGGAITLEGVDCSVKLEITHEGSYFGVTDLMEWKVLDQDTSKSLVHKLLDLAGWTRPVILPNPGPRVVRTWNGTSWVDSTVTAPGIEDKVRRFEIRRGDPIHERLASVLFDYGYVYHCNGKGELVFLDFKLPDSVDGVPEYSEAGLPIIREIKVKRKDHKEKSYSVGYQKYMTTKKGTPLSMLDKTCYPEYILHAWNDASARCWPPETDRDGNISNMLAFRTEKDPAGESLGVENVLEPWRDPGIRSASNWFWMPHQADIAFYRKRKVTRTFLFLSWEEETSYPFYITAYPDGRLVDLVGDEDHQVALAHIQSVSFDQDGLRLKLKRPTTHPWSENYELIFRGVYVRGSVGYNMHSRETVNDETAPRIRAGSGASLKLTKTYVSPMLIDPVRAKKLADTLFQNMAGADFSFKTLHKPSLGSVVKIKHIGKGLDAVARISKVAYSPGRVVVYEIQAESTTDVQYSDPMILDGYSAPPSEGLEPGMPIELIQAVDSQGRVTKPIEGAVLPPGVVPEKSGLFLLKEHMGYFIPVVGWVSRISEDGSAKFIGKFTVGNLDHFLEFDPATGIMKLKGQMEIDGDSVVTGLIKSANFEAGTSGFQIDSDGNAEFNQITVRADILKYGGIPVESDDVINLDYITQNSSHLYDADEKWVKRNSDGEIGARKIVYQSSGKIFTSTTITGTALPVKPWNADFIKNISDNWEIKVNVTGATIQFDLENGTYPDRTWEGWIRPGTSSRTTLYVVAKLNGVSKKIRLPNAQSVDTVSLDVPAWSGSDSDPNFIYLKVKSCNAFGAGNNFLQIIEMKEYSTSPAPIDNTYYRNSPTITYSGTSTQNIDWSAADVFNINMNGNLTLTFNNQRRTTIRLVIAHHATVSYTITFPSSYHIGTAGVTAKTYTIPSGGNRYTIYDVFSHNTTYYVTEGKFYA